MANQPYQLNSYYLNQKIIGHWHLWGRWLVNISSCLKMKVSIRHSPFMFANRRLQLLVFKTEEGGGLAWEWRVAFITFLKGIKKQMWEKGKDWDQTNDLWKIQTRIVCIRKEVGDCELACACFVKGRGNLSSCFEEPYINTHERNSHGLQQGRHKTF